MANKEHLDLLKQGAEVWNTWRQEHPDIRPDLTRADLHKAKLVGVDLTWAHLQEANLTRADLSWAHLHKADLTGAHLHKACLVVADLQKARLQEANLTRAYLQEANLTRADLQKANFTRTNFQEANLTRAHLHEANLHGAYLIWTIFGDVDLSMVIGLDTVSHLGPSTIGIDTIYRSKGNIPDGFLRGAGVPDNFIDYMHSLVGQAIEYYSCFISYSSKDQAFAERLYADLQSNNVRCWFAPEDLKIGERIRVGIDEAIRLHDKLLLVLSKTSVTSDWVEQEVETALARERREKRLVLFPVRLDDTVMNVDTGWPALIRNTRSIGDFRRWKNRDDYQKALQRLLRDLKAAAQAPGG